MPRSVSKIQELRYMDGLFLLQEFSLWVIFGVLALMYSRQI